MAQTAAVRERDGWQPHRISAQTGGGTDVVLWLFSLLWFSVLVFMGRKGGFAPTVPFFVAGFLPLGMALSGTRARRYHASELELLAPAVGRVEGIVHTPVSLSSDARFRIELLWMELRGADHPDRVRWRSFKVVAPLPPESGAAGRIPFSIDLPPGFPQGTPEDLEASTYWSLEVRSERGARGFFARFHVPVSAGEAGAAI